MSKIDIAFIGGSGLYDVEGIETEEELNVETPWGNPSDSVIIGKMGSKKIGFLARHGRGHYLTPSQVPSRANIAALKHLGAEHIIAFSAVGSLREEIEPEDFVLPDQIIDRTKSLRPSTFFDDGLVFHAPFGDPFDSELADFIDQNKDAAGVKFHKNKTLVCMEGPAFSTRAESHLYRSWGADIINMSVLPEAKLAREAEISYQMICMSTDYDSWREGEEHVSVEIILKHMHNNAAAAKKLIPVLASKELPANKWKGSVTPGIITAPEKRKKEALEKIRFLYPDL